MTGSKLSRRGFLSTAASGAGALAAAKAHVGALGAMNSHPRPNILFVFSDQQHWRALGAEDSFFKTPVFRAAARSPSTQQSTRFT